MYDKGQFLKEWQVKDKINESIFSQFAFNHIRMTQTKKIITHRVLKFHKWILGDVCEESKFLKELQVTDRIIE